MSSETLLEVKQLKKHFPVHSGLLLRQTGSVYAVDGVSFDLAKGETLGLVGESGCGKSTAARTVVRIYEPTAGDICFNGQSVTGLKGSALLEFRRNVTMVFQDPFSSLNPRMTIAKILETPLRVHKLGTAKERRQKVRELLNRVGLGDWAQARYPHEFSGGQRQRIAIARAISLRPQLVVADEPVSALDVSVQAQILNLFKDLQDDLGMAYLFIAHDLALVKHISHRIAVMYLGKVVEMAGRDALFDNPRHPYTQALIKANPTPGHGQRKKRQALGGDVPSPLSPPSGCHFHPRCPHAQPQCQQELPQLRNLGAELRPHLVSCHFAEKLSGATV